MFGANLPYEKFLKDPKARVSEKLQKTMYVPAIVLVLWFVVEILNYQGIIHAITLQSLVGWLVPLSIGLYFLSTGVWGIYSGILPIPHTVLHLSDLKVYPYGGWVPNSQSRMYSIGYTVIGIIIIAISIILFNNSNLPV